MIIDFLGSFELALLRMSRYYCIEKKAVMFMDQLLPMEAFLSTGIAWFISFLKHEKNIVCPSV